MTPTVYEMNKLQLNKSFAAVNTATVALQMGHLSLARRYRSNFSHDY